MPGDWVEVWLFNYNGHLFVDTLRRRNAEDTNYIEGLITDVGETRFRIQDFEIDSGQLEPELREDLDVNEFVSVSVRLESEALIAEDVVFE